MNQSLDKRNGLKPIQKLRRSFKLKIQECNTSFNASSKSSSVSFSKRRFKLSYILNSINYLFLKRKLDSKKLFAIKINLHWANF